MISFCKIGCKITLFFAYSQIKCTKSAKMCTLRLFCAILTLPSDGQFLFLLWLVLFIFWRCLSECALKAFTEIFGVWEATLIGYLRHVLAGCFQHLHSFTDACLSQEFHRRRGLSRYQSEKRPQHSQQQWRPRPRWLDAPRGLPRLHGSSLHHAAAWRFRHARR